MQSIVQSIKLKLVQSPNESSNEVFEEIKTKPLIQTHNLLRVLSLNRKSLQLPQGLFTCNNKNCKLCTIYLKLCTNFKTSKNVIWYTRSHRTYQSKNVIIC